MTPGQQRYREYLTTEHWRQKRERILELAAWTCEVCWRRPANQVHHDNYSQLGAEPDHHLVACCKKCHQDIHCGVIYRKGLGARADRARKRRLAA